MSSNTCCDEPEEDEDCPMENYYEYTVIRAEHVSEYCFGCGLNNDEGLHARFFATEEGHMLSIVEPRSVHQSYPNRMHGGITSAILDETIGRAINLTSDDWGVTINLSVTFRKPVPLDTTLYCRAKIIRDDPRTFIGAGEIILENGDVAAQAEGRFIRQSLTQITGEDVETEDMGEALLHDPRPLPKKIKFPTNTGLDFMRFRKF